MRSDAAGLGSKISILELSWEKSQREFSSPCENDGRLARRFSTIFLQHQRSMLSCIISPRAEKSIDMATASPGPNCATVLSSMDSYYIRTFSLLEGKFLLKFTRRDAERTQQTNNEQAVMEFFFTRGKKRKVKFLHIVDALNDAWFEIIEIDFLTPSRCPKKNIQHW